MSAHAVFYKKLRARSFFFYGFCLLCVVYVAFNILYSQKYNINMYGVMNGDVISSTTYLKHIWGTSLFNLEVKNYADEGRPDILNKWRAIQSENKRRIGNLEVATKSHPYSPELYYNLHLLYLENGENGKALENLSKARQIDPSIK